MKPVMDKSNGVEKKENQDTQGTQVTRQEQESEYTIPLSKYRGQRLQDIDLSELDSYANWLHKTLDKNVYKGNIENAKEFIVKVNEFMGFDKRTQEESKEVEKKYTTDDLPF